MKRSEAVDLIFKRLGHLGISEMACDDVLDILEKAGMVPPIVWKAKDPENHMLAARLEWEGEDE
jgi:hypothetical protein